MDASFFSVTTLAVSLRGKKSKEARSSKGLDDLMFDGTSRKICGAAIGIVFSL